MRYSNELEHFGTRGMQWGYTDGKRNGKRTARYYDYDKKMMSNLYKSNLNLLDRNRALKKNDYIDYTDHDVAYEKHAAAAAKYNKMRRDAGGLDYNIGYAAGQISRGAKAVSKFASKSASSVSKKINSGIKWFKKLF